MIEVLVELGAGSMGIFASGCRCALSLVLSIIFKKVDIA